MTNQPADSPVRDCPLGPTVTYLVVGNQSPKAPQLVALILFVDTYKPDIGRIVVFVSRPSTASACFMSATLLRTKVIKVSVLEDRSIVPLSSGNGLSRTPQVPAYPAYMDPRK